MKSVRIVPEICGKQPGSVILNSQKSIHILAPYREELDNAAVRHLLNESVGIFVNLQRMATSRTLGADELVLVSEKYRSLLRCCCLSLQESSLSGMLSSAGDLELLKLYQAAELILSLCEVIFINPSGELASYELRRWGCWHFTKADEWLREIQSENGSPAESHPRFWDSVFMFILFGRLDEGRSLLLSHSKQNDAAFASLDELIRKNPLNVRGVDFNPDVWAGWQRECRRRYEEGKFSKFPQLEAVARLFSGDESVFDDLLFYFDNWYELLVSRTWHLYPMTKIADLHRSVPICMRQFPNSPATPMDRILQAVFEFDILTILKDISLSFNNWWFAGHLADLFFHCQCDEVRQVSHSQSLRDFLVLNYGFSLMDHRSLWELGIFYLDSCGQFGSKALEFYLEKMPIDSERMATRVRNICSQRGFDHLAKSICRSRAIESLKSGRLSAAVSCCLQSKDSELCGFVAEQLLSQSGSSRLLHSLNLLDNLGELKLLSPALAFLGKYKEFLGCVAANQLGSVVNNGSSTVL